MSEPPFHLPASCLQRQQRELLRWSAMECEQQSASLEIIHHPESNTEQPFILLAAGHPGYQAMSVQQVQGGNETNPMWASEVSNPDFQKALEASLKAFNYIVPDGGVDKYKVTASITGVDKPFMGLDMSVTMKVRYSVTNTSGGLAFDDTIAATGTATMGEAFAGVERLRLAIEKAAKANIEAFLGRLAKELK